MTCTVFGSFSGWLAIIICSGSFDNNAAANPYGLVVYLTLSNVMAGFVAFESGLLALVGFNKKYGQSIVYFVMTQALIS